MTYEIVNAPQPADTSINISMFDADDAQVDSFMLLLDGDATEWWIDQVKANYDNYAEIIDY